MSAKRSKPKYPVALKVYVPSQAADLPKRVAEAASAESTKEMRTVSVSEWIVRAILEKLGRDAL